MRAGRLRLILAALGGLAAAGCDTPQNYLIHTGGRAASWIAWLGWEAIIAFCAATLVTWGLLLWFALRRRGSLAEHAPIDVNSGQAWILIGGFLVPLGVLIWLFAGMLDLMVSLPMGHPHRIMRRGWHTSGPTLRLLSIRRPCAGSRFSWRPHAASATPFAARPRSPTSARI